MGQWHMRFRLDSWWFGVPLLVRGPLINLPVVLATDFPPIQIVCIAMILTTMMVPWLIFVNWSTAWLFFLSLSQVPKSSSVPLEEIQYIKAWNREERNGTTGCYQRQAISQLTLCTAQRKSNACKQQSNTVSSADGDCLGSVNCLSQRKTITT